MQNVAFGFKDMSLSDGTELKVPKALRKVVREEMFRNYLTANMDPRTGFLNHLQLDACTFAVAATYDNDLPISVLIVFILCAGEPFPGTLKRTQFMKMATLATGGQQKILTGLDNISQRYGNENFEDLRALVLRVCDTALHLFPSHKKNLLTRIDKFQDFLKRDYVNHLRPTSTCAAHCLTRLLGGYSVSEAAACPDCIRLGPRKPCKACKERRTFCTNCPESCGSHEDHCDQCDELFGIYSELDYMIQLAARISPADITLPSETDDGDFCLFSSDLFPNVDQPSANQQGSVQPHQQSTEILAKMQKELMQDFRILAKRYMARTQKYIAHLARAHLEQV